MSLKSQAWEEFWNYYTMGIVKQLGKKIEAMWHE